MNSQHVILILIVIAIILQVYQCMAAKSEKYEDMPTKAPEVNWANCQSNAYSSGCVFGAAVGGTQYDWSTFCNC